MTIIESLSGNTWAVQDSVWYHVADGMGYDTEIVPQSKLDEIANLESTQVLIVSSGTIDYGLSNHLQTIEAFVQSGRPVNIQSEYLVSYQGNLTFGALMQAMNADFEWTGTTPIRPTAAQAFPNPFIGRLTVLTIEPETMIRLLDPSGRIVMASQTSATVTRMNTSHLHSGLYFLLTGNGENTQTMRLLRE